MMSPIQHFNTAPPVGSANRFTALVYGDMGISPIPRAYKTADYATEEANNGTAAFVFHNGDISYARGFVSSVTNSNLNVANFLLKLGQLLVVYVVVQFHPWFKF